MLLSDGHARSGFELFASLQEFERWGRDVRSEKRAVLVTINSVLAKFSYQHRPPRSSFVMHCIFLWWLREGALEEGVGDTAEHLLEIDGIRRAVRDYEREDAARGAGRIRGVEYGFDVWASVI